MLVKLLNFLADSFLSRSHCLAPISLTGSQTKVGLSIQEIFDGYALATPKRRTPRRRLWANKYGSDNWKYGQKLIKAKRNITTCFECGSFHEFHTICRACFNKVQEAVSSKKISESERPLPLWFAPNLKQPSASPAKEMDSTVKEVENLTVKEVGEKVT